MVYLVKKCIAKGSILILLMKKKNTILNQSNKNFAQQLSKEGVF